MNRIKQFRLLQGFTQEGLAEHANLSVSYLSEIENGRVMPSLRALRKIAAVLKMPVASLLDSDGQGVANSGNIDTNFVEIVNNVGTNYGPANFAPGSGAESDASVSEGGISNARGKSACNANVCPFVCPDGHGSVADSATRMIIASLYGMSAEKRHRLLQYALELADCKTVE